ncbi:MAG TPA: serine/threonine-protein kinase [Gemmataceae bacterium]|jgi:serine/threonine protein kinase/tetratricopeptide (TPR) repeat protein
MTEETLFAVALEKTDPAERAAFLDRACRDDPALRERIEARLRRLERCDDSYKDPTTLRATRATVKDQASHTVGEASSQDVFVPAREDSGKHIGPYRLLEKLGEGGMGIVWMAEQTEPVRRRVALKVVKTGMDSVSVLARFDAERQALAMMDHPNIAKVLDAASTSEGRPYFVMELVQGVPLTRFCDQEQLTPQERLELFVRICQAVQHAHQKGIIHRDLKPSNVLVARYDGEPTPKIIDFGIAKAVSQKLSEYTIATEVGQVVGTLEYMAPEQAEMTNLDIDTRADVYSLGVLLYELLTGATPFPSGQLRRLAFTEILRTIREVEPPKPSTNLSGATDLPTLADKRRLEPQRLVKLVRGELDWIVMKCLEKERTRRYQTASDLARDIERYLAKEPVSAGPPSATYRLRKFVARHKGPVIAAALVVLALVGGIVGTSLGLLEAKRQRDEVDRQRTAAEGSAATARQAEAEVRAVLTFFQDKVLAAARPKEQDGGLGVDASIQAAADAAEPKIAVAFHDQPRVEAEIRHALGQTYLYLGQARQAIQQYKRTVELRKEHLGPDHPDTLISMNNLAWAYQDDGRWNDALAVAAETLERRQAVFGPDHFDTITSMHRLAFLYLESGRWKDALPLYERTLELCKDRLGVENPLTLGTMNDLALLYKQTGRLKDALPLYQESLRQRRTVLGPDHPDTLQSMNNLAMAYMADGRAKEAVPLLEETWQKKKERLGPNHRETLITLNNLAEAYQAAGRLDDALPIFEKTLKGLKAVLGPDHRITLISMSDLMGAYRECGRIQDAVNLGEETLKRRKAALGMDHPDTLTSMNNLALAYRAVGRPKDAALLFEETLKLQLAKRGPDHPYVLYTQNSLARTYQDLGRLDDALPLAESALVKARKQFNPNNPAVLIFVENMAMIYDIKGQHEKAEPLWRELLTSRQQKQPDVWATFHAQSRLGANLLVQKKYAEAESLLLQGYQGMEERAGKISTPSRMYLSEALDRLVQLYTLLDKKEKAEEWRKKKEAMTTEERAKKAQE